MAAERVPGVRALGDGPDASLAPLIQKVDHVALAVASLEDAVALFGDLLGGRFLSGGDNDDAGVRLVHLMLPGMKIELLQPTCDDSILGRHLAKHGPGFHHLTFLVDDVPLTVDRLAANGMAAVGTSRPHPRWTETFLPPAATFGALLQFVATSRRWDLAARDYTLADVLAGDVVWQDWVACLRTPPGGPDTP